MTSPLGLDHRDFSLRAYEDLVVAVSRTHQPIRFDQWMERERGEGLPTRAAVFRHDVDRKIDHTVRCAEVLARHGLVGVFYFRVPYTADPDAIRHVASLGHEVGYHYETLSKARGDLARAVELFAAELEALRAIVPVRTACMHGVPLLPWDNRDIWTVTTLDRFALLGEPYLSLDFHDMLYMTDTGRSWSGHKSSLRDKVAGPALRGVSSTRAFVAAADRGELPPRVMITFHPERWSSSYVDWTVQLVQQRVKNVVKRLLGAARARRARSAGAA